MTPATTEPDSTSALHTAHRTGLIDQVIVQLRDQITSGAWPIGGRIPTETELAALTGTSRNTVREAVQALVHAGLLQRRQGSGTYVLASSELAGAVSRQVAASHRQHVLEVRRALEVGAAQLAAQRRSAADIVDARRLIAERNQAGELGLTDDVVALDVMLHRVIVRASRNPMMVELYENVVQALDESIRAYIAGAGRIAGDEHVALIDAIEVGDSTRAATEAACFLDDQLAETRATATARSVRAPDAVTT